MSFKKDLTGKKETRFFKIKELRSSKNDDGDTVIGRYSAVFESLSVDMGWSDWSFFEKIDSGAFTKALKNSDIRALFNHDPNFILGRESAGTLIVKVDDIGLDSDIILPNTTAGRDLDISMQRGDIREQSFSFIVGKQRWEEDEEKRVTTRTILEFEEILDLGPVTFPAYTDTDIAKRSLEEFRKSRDKPEKDEFKELDEKILQLELELI